MFPILVSTKIQIHLLDTKHLLLLFVHKLNIKRLTGEFSADNVALAFHFILLPRYLYILVYQQTWRQLVLNFRDLVSFSLKL